MHRAPTAAPAPFTCCCATEGKDEPDWRGCAICNSICRRATNTIRVVLMRRGNHPDSRTVKNVDRRRTYAEFLERLTLGITMRAATATATPPVGEPKRV